MQGALGSAQKTFDHVMLREIGIVTPIKTHELMLWGGVDRMLERPFHTNAQIQCDKIFSSLWINSRTVVCGTKDSKLLSFDVPFLKLTEHTLPSVDIIHLLTCQC
eukprot:TRINITY_DN1654_c0_g1_i1.p2 TRINITY_DN1654_c0_g1~~TRINITY_DN1654_c0_g1_i1.p2  ORF type:complete len:105 (-),score=8.70 TRINITY_DN1654_c0_g1_i1:1012-1326(-)